MKTESVREVKNNLSRVIEELPETGPVLITKNGRTRAVLLPVDDNTDLEALVLSQSKRLWDLIDRSIVNCERQGLTALEDLPLD
jgi:prevent-host-death family protein